MLLQSFGIGVVPLLGVILILLLTSLKMPDEAAKKRAEPYDKIVEQLPEMLRDTLELVKSLDALQ
ncbi:MAG: hypothetical protein OEU68_07005 [Nitrospira sp.]|jgi:hypothetical protein|nr:hypothetical protein [Nitrospira sp.]MDH4243264.1 hypothetical protein [Nitrospira sp.]MDH4357064.1 hypothetical protein [Nitrospira sp.]MDH5317391.1 hypothetical protein [Nitrospira sp.]